MISKKVHDELMSVRRVLHYLPVSPSTENGWTPHERQLFWAALDRFPRGPWTVIAESIGTKSTRQAMTHGQKLRLKFKRWFKRLHRNPTARSLMDGIAVTTTSSPTVMTKVDVSVSTSQPLTVAPVMSSGSRTLTESSSSPQTDVFQGWKDIHCQHGELTCDTNNIQGRGGQMTSGYTSTNLQMLFEPHTVHAVASSSVAAPTNLSELKHSDARIVPYPICEEPAPGRNLLDELVDVLWNDRAVERK
ncbi:hypothetical protein P3T76_011322 [Phytophthora citrophthora]|uniref:Myb-like domain-containing protein n=1 Tax=Phytophthora citrophthora TaxID=4793 RepID=A0AAD9LG76_9STRA|nr:hypothetical protein P3T76_011322 [Phytophthora citrophthora]